MRIHTDLWAAHACLALACWCCRVYPSCSSLLTKRLSCIFNDVAEARVRQAEPLAFAEKLTLLVQSHAELLINAEDMAVAQSLLQKVRGQDTHTDEGESGSMRRELNSEQVRPCTKC